VVGTCRSPSKQSAIPDTIDVQEIKARLLGIQALETARCFEEAVLTDVREADVGSILGFGFAPFTGGTLSYIDMMGTPRFLAMCDRFAACWQSYLRESAASRRRPAP
jgi:3-hydroxyacyl-CoA dehydrogenase/enoyl-CoA hydratase/3-hydroxybutyryl-CoA epimerase